MAGGLTTEETTRLLNSSLAAQPYNLDTQPYVALTTEKASASDAGTEVGTLTGAYERQPAAFTVIGNTAQLATDINFTGMPAATVVGINVYDALTGGARKWWADLSTQRTTLDGDTISFAANNISFTIA